MEANYPVVYRTRFVVVVSCKSCPVSVSTLIKHCWDVSEVDSTPTSGWVQSQPPALSPLHGEDVENVVVWPFLMVRHELNRSRVSVWNGVTFERVCRREMYVPCRPRRTLTPPAIEPFRMRPALFRGVSDVVFFVRPISWNTRQMQTHWIDRGRYAISLNRANA